MPVIAGGVEAAAAAGPLRLLERQSPPLDHARLQGRPARLRHGRRGRSSKSPSDWPAGETGQRPARHARRGLSRWARARTPPTEDTIVAAQLRRGLSPTSRHSPRATEIISSTKRTRTTPSGWCSTTTAQAVVANPPAVSDLRRRRWIAIYDAALHAAAASRLRRADSRRSRWSRIRCRSCAAASAAARSARSRPTRPHHPKPQPGIGARGNRADGGRSEVQRRRQRHRRADRQHVSR